MTSNTSINIRASATDVGSSDFLEYDVVNVINIGHMCTDPDGDGIYSTEVNIPIDNDDTMEADGTIELTLKRNGSIYRLGTATVGQLTVFDDDSPPTVSIINKSR